MIYDKIVSKGAEAEEIQGAALLLAALTLDAKFFHGDWRVIGNMQDNLATLPQPWFKVARDGEDYVEARDRTSTRRATRVEADGLRLRTVVAPVRIENAIKALHGFGEWQPRYEDLRAAYAIESARLMSSLGNANQPFPSAPPSLQSASKQTFEADGTPWPWTSRPASS